MDEAKSDSEKYLHMVQCDQGAIKIYEHFLQIETGGHVVRMPLAKWVSIANSLDRLRAENELLKSGQDNLAKKLTETESLLDKAKAEVEEWKKGYKEDMKKYEEKLFSYEKREASLLRQREIAIEALKNIRKKSFDDSQWGRYIDAVFKKLGLLKTSQEGNKE